MAVQRWMRWVADYERAWRTPGTAALAGLFAADATYRTAPLEPPFEGLEAIARMWEEGRLGADEAFSLEAEPVAIGPPTGVVRVDVRYGAPRSRTYVDLWIVTLGDDGRCTRFEEWPFWPPGSGGGYTPGPAAN